MIGYWKNPYLIQRLQKPFEKPETINPFNFGGGLLLGGFDKKAFTELQKIFRFDYMGSAEFEWGIVPKAFESLIELRKKKLLVAGEMKRKGKKIYFISQKEVEENVVKYISLLAKHGDYYKKRGDKFHSIWLKESTRLRRELESKEPIDVHSSLGWIDVENCFMFFIDKEMFDNTLKFFGLELTRSSPKKTSTTGEQNA